MNAKTQTTKTKPAKITQAQTRILRHKIQSMANESCRQQREICDKSRTAITEKSKKIAERLVKKHRKALSMLLDPQIETWGSIRCTITYDVNHPVVTTFQKEFNAEVKKAGLDGLTDEQCKVAFPALGIEYLAVPKCQRDEWRALADEIDSAFMAGDAEALLLIIQQFNK